MNDMQSPATDDPQDDRGGRRRINWFIILLIAAPFVLLIAREFSRGGLIGYMRVADVGDLLLLSPLYAVILIYMLFYMVRYQAPASVQIAFISFCFLFMFGQAMHLTANSINTFATEVRDYKEILPEDLYTLIFDLDERLSHWIMMSGAIGLISVGSSSTANCCRRHWSQITRFWLCSLARFGASLWPLASSRPG